MNTDTLKLRRVGIDTYHENVEYLHRNGEIYRVEDFQALSKINICIDNKRILTVLNVVTDNSIISPDGLGLSLQFNL